MKVFSTWYSERVGQDVSMARWGYHGTPVLIFPTAGGDAEEIERSQLIDAVADSVTSGKVKIYSCDSVAGRALLRGDGDAAHQAWMQNQFQEYVRHELVPAIRVDCETPDIEIVVSGSSIGAFNALSCLCRYPDVFKSAICMSGTYNLQKFFKGELTPDFYASSPVHFVPEMNGDALEAVRKRYVVLASGEGDYEDIGESWHAARVLGDKQIPNRVDSWGRNYPHEWGTWRHMLPRYLEELA